MISSPSYEPLKSLYQPYPRNDLDIESGTGRRHRRHKKSFCSFRRMLATLKHRIHHHTLSFSLFSITFLLLLLLFLSVLRPSLFSSTSDRALPMDASPFSELRNLIMVAGHSVYTGGDAASEGSWYLEPYQRGLGQAATFVRHIHEGVAMAARDGDALLLFSGGETRRSAGPLSEAQSYWRVAEEKKWFGGLKFLREMGKHGLLIFIAFLIVLKSGRSLSSKISFVENKIASHKVVIFSKSYCQYCKRVKSIFHELNQITHVVELDERDDGMAIHDALKVVVGERTVPQVFVEGKHIGGCDDTVAAYENGELEELLGIFEHDDL